jgi:hypothetical protein
MPLRWGRLACVLVAALTASVAVPVILNGIQEARERAAAARARASANPADLQRFEAAKNEWTRYNEPPWVAVYPENPDAQLAVRRLQLDVGVWLRMQPGWLAGVSVNPNQVRVNPNAWPNPSGQHSLPTISRFLALRGYGEAFDIVAGEGINAPPTVLGRYSPATGLVPVQ